jgi:hypothetical protein
LDRGAQRELEALSYSSFWPCHSSPCIFSKLYCPYSLACIPDVIRCNFNHCPNSLRSIILTDCDVGFDAPTIMASDWTYLNHKDSQETLISLQQLDPSPIDSPDEDLPTSPEDAIESPKSASSSPLSVSVSSLGLSGNGRGPIFYCSSN